MVGPTEDRRPQLSFAEQGPAKLPVGGFRLRQSLELNVAFARSDSSRQCQSVLLVQPASNRADQYQGKQIDDEEDLSRSG